MCIRDRGYDVRLAENATAARRIRGELRPDLVLLDIWMPDTDGISLLKEWHAAGHLNMPVVMMSGHGTIDTAVEATRFGAFDFLEKPIALQKLLSTVQTVSYTHLDVYKRQHAACRRRCPCWPRVRRRWHRATFRRAKRCTAVTSLVC